MRAQSCEVGILERKYVAGGHLMHESQGKRTRVLNLARSLLPPSVTRNSMAWVTDPSSYGSDALAILNIRFFELMCTERASFVRANSSSRRTTNCD